MKRLPICAVLATFLPGFFASGCATSPQPDWDKRVGTYTYQQAEAALGQPDNFLRFNDGTFVAEWLEDPGPAPSPALTAGNYGPRRSWVNREGMDALARTTASPRFLQLTFSAENRLLGWEEGRK